MTEEELNDEAQAVLAGALTEVFWKFAPAGMTPAEFAHELQIAYQQVARERGSAEGVLELVQQSMREYYWPDSWDEAAALAED